jgi:prefoldin subunit 5
MNRDMSKTVELLKQRVDSYLQVQQKIKEAAEKLKQESQTTAIRQGK